MDKDRQSFDDGEERAKADSDFPALSENTAALSEGEGGVPVVAGGADIDFRGAASVDRSAESMRAPSDERSGLPPVEPHVHEFHTSSPDEDESMSGGYATVRDGVTYKQSNKLTYILFAVMAVLCIAVGLLSSVLTAHFMRSGETPPSIVTDGKVQQNVAAVVSARKMNIVELECGGLNGSGVVMKRDGKKVYVLTNAHMIERYVNGRRLPNVRFYGEDDYYSAQVVGYSEYYDIAVVYVEHDTVFSVYDLDGSEFFDPDLEYTEGDHVVSVGNAMGMGIACYDGIISRGAELLECNRLFGSADKKTVPVMRTTAVINAGMSGGALFDMNGNFVGLGTYRMSNSDGVDTEGGATTDVENTGFVTPICIVYPVYRAILADANGGAVNYLMRLNLRKSNTSRVGLIETAFGFSCEFRKGKLTVTELDQGTPNSNISKGDVITKINRWTVSDDICKTVGRLLRYSSRGDGETLRLYTTGAVGSISCDGYCYALD